VADINIAKVDPEQRRVWGWAYVAETASGEQVVDHSGDIVDTPEARRALENAFYDYVLKSREGDDGHQVFGAMDLIEAVAMSPDKAREMGLPSEYVPTGLWVGYEFPTDEVGEAAWQKVKGQEHLAFSIVGSGAREAV